MKRWIGGLGAAVLVSATLVAASIALARDSATVDHGGVRAKGLSAAERNAIDIARVDALGGDFGLFVTVTFKGNAAKRIGRGHLRRAVAAMLLQPKTGLGGPAVLGTRGAGKRERLVRLTRSKVVGVSRHRKRMLFFIVGPGLVNVRRITIKTFADVPRSATRTTIRFPGVDSASIAPPSATGKNAACGGRARAIDLLTAAPARGRAEAKRAGAAYARLSREWVTRHCRASITVVSKGYRRLARGSTLCADFKVSPNLRSSLARVRFFKGIAPFGVRLGTPEAFAFKRRPQGVLSPHRLVGPLGLYTFAVSYGGASAQTTVEAKQAPPQTKNCAS